ELSDCGGMSGRLSNPVRRKSIQHLLYYRSLPQPRQILPKKGTSRFENSRRPCPGFARPQLECRFLLARRRFVFLSAVIAAQKFRSTNRKSSKGCCIHFPAIAILGHVSRPRCLRVPTQFVRPILDLAGA